MNLTDITNFFRSRRSSVFIDLASRYMAVVPQDKAQAVLTLFLYAYKTINQSLPPDRDLEELKLLLAKSLPELDTDELADNAEKAVNHAGALDAAHRLATIPVSDRLLLASAILELDKAVTPLKEENRKIFTELAEAMAIYPRRIQDLIAQEAARRATAAKVLNSGAGLAVALVVIIVFILAATFLKSLIFGIILAYFFLPLEKYFEKHFFNTRLITAVSKFFSFFCYPLRKLGMIFSPAKEQTAQEKELAARKVLVMKSSIAALVTVILGALLALMLTVSILIPAAINMGRSVNRWANSSPILGHLENTISAWIKPEEKVLSPENGELAELARKTRKTDDNKEPEIRSVKEFVEWLRPEIRAYIQENSKDIASVAFSKGRGIVSTLIAVLGSFAGLYIGYRNDVPSGAVTIFVLTLTLIVVKLLPLRTLKRKTDG